MIHSRRALLTLSAAAALLAGTLAGAPPALASHSQITFFDATQQLTDPAERAQTFVTLKHLGVRALRIMLYWDAVAPQPNSARKPRFAGTDPASYNWSAYLPALEEAKRLHWPVLLTVTSPVPKWASSTHRDHLTRPSDKDFREFMTAAGKELGPYVALWAIWNEPNQLGWLQPQWNKNGSPASPAIYRGLFLAGYSGLRAAGISSPKMLMGETAPFGNSTVNARREGTVHQMAPLTFLRGTLCLSSRYRPIGHCPRLPAYGYGHHAYPNASGPSYVPPNRDQVTIGTLGRLVRALNLAARAGAIRAGMPIYLTEFGINTRPNPLGVSPAKQAQFDALSEMIAWEDPRVASFGQYELRDDVIPRHHPRNWTGFQTGLETAAGRPKPLYYGFPLPLVVRRSHGALALWGLVRPAQGATSAEILVERAPRRRFVKLAAVHTDAAGYFQLRSRVHGVAWKLRWVSPEGSVYEGPPIALSR